MHGLQGHDVTIETLTEIGDKNQQCHIGAAETIH